MNLLVAKDLSVTYLNQSTAAIQNIFLEFGRQDLVVVLGPSGCGKSTLLGALAGFIPASSGSIFFDGHPVNSPSGDRTVVFQQDGLFPWMNVAANIGFGPKLHGVNSNSIDKIVKNTLELVGLTGFEHYSTWELSGGMRQRVNLARAIASQSRILLMDEPFGALDPFNREKMQQLLLKVWNHSNRGVFLITHDVEEALFLATEIIVMSARPGRIITRLKVNFGKRYCEGEGVRRIKSDPEFINHRERLFASLVTEPQ